MKKNTLIAICIGVVLIGLVLFKNVVSLNKRVADDENKLKVYSTAHIELLLPERLVEESDTSYLEDGSIFTTVKGVAGSMDNNGKLFTYNLSIADYSKEFTDPTSFRLDSMQTNLYNLLSSTKDFQLFYLTPIDFHGKKAIKYFGKRRDSYETTITLNIENKAIAISSVRPDSLDNNLNQILASVKFKNSQ